MTFIYTPDFTSNNEAFQHLHVADGILFVLNASHSLTEIEEETLKKIKETMYFFCSNYLPINSYIATIHQLYLDGRVTASLLKGETGLSGPPRCLRPYICCIYIYIYVYIYI